MALSFTAGSLNMDFTTVDAVFTAQHTTNDEITLKVAA